MDIKKTVNDVLDQVKVWINDKEQDYINLDYAWRWLKVLDFSIQNNLNEIYEDENGDLYVIYKGMKIYD